ncbi:MAG TPA: hypothetical protein DHV59_15840 [Oxalobacteraceae bacterium]|nr:hypothetical protein [Oxalobacteraceae bacterium]
MANPTTSAVIQLNPQLASASTLINTTRIGHIQSQRFITTSYAFNDVILPLSNAALAMTAREFSDITAASMPGFRIFCNCHN